MTSARAGCSQAGVGDHLSIVPAALEPDAPRPRVRALQPFWWGAQPAGARPLFPGKVKPLDGKLQKSDDCYLGTNI